MTTSTMGASALAVFSFQSAEVRTIALNGDPWFILSDVTGILGFSRSRDAARILDDDEKGAHILRTPGGDQEVTIISESGVYALALKSRRPEARPFRKWVTSEVLPAIRKTGAYATNDAATEEMTRQARDAFRFGRWLMHFDNQGNMVMNPVPMEALVIEPRDVAGLRSLIGEYVPFELIPEVLRLANERVLMCYRANVADNKARRNPTLPEATRQVLAVKYQTGDYKALADDLGIHESTAKKIIGRLRRTEDASHA